VGVPAWTEISVDQPLRTNVGRRNRTTVDPERGKSALTVFRTLQRYPDHALIAAHPVTGRTHQIRAHLYHLGFSIASDPLYGDGQISQVIPRLALHARSLSFWHPSTGEMLAFEADYPPDFELAIAQLR
jgi:23S rRNA-/tRNA-specific pseudouridylate synthase